MSEAASLTLLEAMAAGLPVIVTAVGGNPEIVREGIDGLHVPRGDAAACGVAIRQMLANLDLAARLGANGRSRHATRNGTFAMLIAPAAPICYHRAA